MKKIKIYIASPIDRRASTAITSLCREHLRNLDTWIEVRFWGSGPENVGGVVKRSLGCRRLTNTNSSICGEYRPYG